jgi:ribosomal protein L35
MKTHKGISKRFFKRGSSLMLKHRQSHRSHLNRKRSSSYMQTIRKNVLLSGNKIINNRLRSLLHN